MASHGVSTDGYSIDASAQRNAGSVPKWRKKLKTSLNTLKENVIFIFSRVHHEVTLTKSLSLQHHICTNYVQKNPTPVFLVQIHSDNAAAWVTSCR